MLVIGQSNGFIVRQGRQSRMSSNASSTASSAPSSVDQHHAHSHSNSDSGLSSLTGTSFSNTLRLNCEYHIIFSIIIILATTLFLLFPGGVGAGGFGRTSTMSPVSTLSTLSSISSSSSVASSTSNASSVSGNSRQINLRKTSSTMPAPQRPTCGIPKRSPNSHNIHSDGSSSIGRMIFEYIFIHEVYPI